MSVDGSLAFGALLTDLSKEFDGLDYELISAKLNSYQFCWPDLKLIQDNLSHRKQRTRITNLYKERLAMFEVPVPLLFNFF